jgi:hypothetical protein
MALTLFNHLDFLRGCLSTRRSCAPRAYSYISFLFKSKLFNHGDLSPVLSVTSSSFIIKIARALSISFSLIFGIFTFVTSIHPQLICCTFSFFSVIIIKHNYFANICECINLKQDRFIGECKQ